MAKTGVTRKSNAGRLKALTVAQVRRLRKGDRLVVVDGNQDIGPNGTEAEVVAVEVDQTPRVTVRRHDRQDAHPYFYWRFAKAPRKAKAVPLPEAPLAGPPPALFPVGTRVRLLPACVSAGIVYSPPGNLGTVEGGSGAYNIVLIDGFGFTYRCRPGIDIEAAPAAVVTLRGPAVWRKGDRVRCLVSCGGFFTAGKVYVLRDDASSDWLWTEVDDTGSRLNGWGRVNFTWEGPALPTEESHLEARVSAIEAILARLSGIEVRLRKAVADV